MPSDALSDKALQEWRGKAEALRDLLRVEFRPLYPHLWKTGRIRQGEHGVMEAVEFRAREACDAIDAFIDEVMALRKQFCGADGCNHHKAEHRDGHCYECFAIGWPRSESHWHPFTATESEA